MVFIGETIIFCDSFPSNDKLLFDMSERPFLNCEEFLPYLFCQENIKLDKKCSRVTNRKKIMNRSVFICQKHDRVENIRTKYFL